MNKIWDSYLSCIAMAHSPQVLGEDVQGEESEEDMGNRDGEGFGMSVNVGVCNGIGIRKVIEFHQSSLCTLFSPIPDVTNNVFTLRGMKNVMD
jgi:hypothetical protein